MEGVGSWVEYIPGAFGESFLPLERKPSQPKAGLPLASSTQAPRGNAVPGDINLPSLLISALRRNKPETHRGMRGRGRGREKFLSATSCRSKLGETHLCRQCTGLLLHNSLVSLSGNEVETGPAARK